MLKNLSPIVTGSVLRALDDAPRGSWIAVVGAGSGVAGIPVAGSPESVVSALLEVTPLEENLPIVVDRAMAATDLSYAVVGMASDAEGRDVALLPVDEPSVRRLLAAARVRMLVEAASPVAVVFCKGAC